MELHKMDYLVFSEMRMRKRRLFCTNSHHNVPYILARARVQLLNMLYISTHLSVPHGENILKPVLYIYLEIGTMYELS